MDKRTQYINFLRQKIEIAPESGLDIEIPLIQFQDGTQLKPHQRDAINWAITRGRWQIDARAKWNSSGNRFLSPDELRQFPIDRVNKYFSEFAKESVYDFGLHVDIAQILEKMDKLPATFETLRIPARNWYVWHDVNRMITLNNSQTQKNLQNHICPLQFDIVDRVIERYSNPGELVDDPFNGIGTTTFRAIKLKRKGYGSELNPEYWKDGLSYLRAAELEVNAPTLFDLIES